MPVKYQCPKCGRRFAEWGAEKLGFKCPADDACPANASEEVIELVRVGTQEEKSPRKTTLKRVPRRAVAGVPASEVDEKFGEDVNSYEDSDVDTDGDEDIEVGDEEEEYAEGEDDESSDDDSGDEDYDEETDDADADDEEEED